MELDAPPPYPWEEQEQGQNGPPSAPTTTQSFPTIPPAPIHFYSLAARSSYGRMHGNGKGASATTQSLPTIPPAPAHLYSLTAERSYKRIKGNENRPTFLRDSWECWSDGNETLATRIRKKNQRLRFHRIVKGLLKVGSTSSEAYKEIPEKRHFKWMITSHHVARGYRDPKLRFKSPWLVHTRCLMIDASDPTNDASLRAWREHPVSRQTGFVCHNDIHAPQEMKRGRRSIFSLQTDNEPRWLTGRWLMVVDLYGLDPEYLESLDVRRLVSFETAI